jgi:uncharacterized membrane protein YbhN (UPF0104 family)
MTQRRHWWLVLKWALTLAILAGVAWQFVKILGAPELGVWEQVRGARLGWLIASGGLYLLGLGFPALYWSRLQSHLGQQLPSALTLCRAYYVSHLGKYVPGKAWALVLRATFIGGSRRAMAVAGMAAFYEVLTSMTGGVLFAAILVSLLVPTHGTLPSWASIHELSTLRLGDSEPLDGSLLIVLALLLSLPVGLPILPPIFNRLVNRTTSNFRQPDAPPLPRVRAVHLMEGLALSCGTWLLLGASMTAVFHSVLPQPPEWTLFLWGRQTAFFAIGYVASFLIFVVPGSIGVREYFLALLLVPELVTGTGLERAQARAAVVVSVLILRLVSMIAELLMAGMLYWIPRRA